MPSSVRVAEARPHVLALAGMCLAMLAMPLVWRAARGVLGPPDAAPPSYLPALELTRERAPFNPDPIADLRRVNPGYVIIGDSMAGRVDPVRLSALTGEDVAPLIHNATGSAYWFLVFKNYVIASGVRPKRILVFFRDTNLTDPMFRLTGPRRGDLDPVALEREDELNAVVAARTQGVSLRDRATIADRWSRVHAIVDHAYGIERARVWIEPAVASWLARIAVGRQRRKAFLADMNGMFELDRLRAFTAADIEAPTDRDTDFRANVTASTLPLFLRHARERGLKLCFVRVLRRPQNGRPPDEPPALTRYVRDLKTYIERNGGAFLDDRDEPELARIPYADGDHIARGEPRRYTEIFVRRLLALPR